METLINKQLCQSVELDGKKYEYISYIPGGNPTALVVVKQILNQEEKKRINNLIMQQPGNKDVEQVGFVILNKDNPQLEMAGGEFCGNATRSAATWYYEQYGLEKINVKVSGVENTLNAGYDPTTKEAFAQMPIYKEKEKIIKVDENITIVEMEGITQIIIKGTPTCFDQPNYNETIKEEAKSIIDQYSSYSQVANAPAVGVMYLIEGDNEEYSMEPVVYVRSIETLFYESACGSGTCSVGLFLAQDESNGEFKYTIQQPSGESIAIQVSIVNNSFTNAIVSGPIKKKINQEYIITEDLEDPSFRLSKLSQKFRGELLSTLGEFRSEQGVVVKSIGYEKLQSFFKKNTSDQDIVVALDGGIYSRGLSNVFNFDITRYYTDSTIDKIIDGKYEYKTRNGGDIEDQIIELKRFIKNNTGKDIVVLDDGKFSGGSIKKVLSLLLQEGIDVSKVILGVNVGGDETIQSIPVISYYNIPESQVAGRVNERDLTDLGGVKTDKGVVSYLSDPKILKAKEGLSGDVFVKINKLLKDTLKTGKKFTGGINETNIFDYDTIIRDQDGTLYQFDGDGTFGGSTLGKLVNENIINFICEKETCNKEESQKIKSEISILEKIQKKPLSISLAKKYNMTRTEVFEATWGSIEPDSEMILNFETIKELMKLSKEKGIKNIIVTSAPRVRAEKVVNFMGTNNFIDKLYTGEDYEIDKGIIFDKIKQETPLDKILSIGDQEKTDILPALEKGIDGYSSFIEKISLGSKGCLLLKTGDRITKTPGSSERSKQEVSDNSEAYNKILKIYPDIIPTIYSNSSNLVQMEYLGKQNLTTKLKAMDEETKLELYKNMFDRLLDTVNQTNTKTSEKNFLDDTIKKIFDQLDTFISPYLSDDDRSRLPSIKEKLQNLFENLNIGNSSSLSLFDFTPDNIFFTDEGKFKTIDPRFQDYYMGLPQISLGVLVQTLKNYNLTIDSFDDLLNQTIKEMNNLIGIDNSTGKKLLILGEIFELCLAVRVRIRNEAKKQEGMSYYNKLIEKINYLSSL